MGQRLVRWAFAFLLVAVTGCAPAADPSPTGLPTGHDPAPQIASETKGGPNPEPQRLSPIRPLTAREVAQLPAPLNSKQSVWEDGEVQADGVWVRFLVWADGCMIGTAAIGTPEYQAEYPCPADTGRLSITHIDQTGMEVAFAGDLSGTFDLQSHQWTLAEDPTPAGLYPVTTRTAVPEVDRVLVAVQELDSERLADLVRLTEIGCTHKEGLAAGAPPCEEGQPEGSPVKVFARAACNVTYLYDEGLAREQTIGYLTNRPLWPYAINRVETSPGALIADRGYEIVLASHHADRFAVTLYLDKEGSMIEVDGGCGTSPVSATDHSSPNAMLSPREIQMSPP